MIAPRARGWPGGGDASPDWVVRAAQAAVRPSGYPEKAVWLVPPRSGGLPVDRRRAVAVGREDAELAQLAQPARRVALHHRSAWNGVLRLPNLLQFLPGAWWITRKGVAARRYPEFAPDGLPLAETATVGVHGEWAAAMELAEQALHGVMDVRAARGLPVPEVGCELATETGQALHGVMDVRAARGLPVPEVGRELATATGRVLAEAELAWPGRRVAVLHGEQTATTAAFEHGAGERIRRARVGLGGAGCGRARCLGSFQDRRFYTSLSNGKYRSREIPAVRMLLRMMSRSTSRYLGMTTGRARLGLVITM